MHVTGQLVEIGELDDECGAEGFVLHCADGSFVTVKGLDRDAVRPLATMLYQKITITAAAA